MMFRLCAIAASFGLASALSAQVIDFEALEFNNGSVNDVGETYEEDGFTLSKGQNEPFPFAVFGTQESRYPGSTALFNNTVDGLIRLTKSNGGSFTARSIDIAMLNGPGTVRVTFFNDRGERLDVSHSDNDLPLNLDTYNFGSFGQNVNFIEWTQSNSFHQFDNIVIPAPAGAGALALGGLVAIRRRR